ncbi:MAG: hypothetical protein WCS09_02770 [Pseudomonadota bacterium]|jgi:cell wall-associated NlpC family hydrolase
MRANGWDVALLDWAATRIGLPFAWGQTDCTLLVAEAIDVITGATACASRFRDQWSDMASAVAWSRANRLDLLDGCVKTGCVTVVANPLSLQRGDLLLVPFMRFDDVQVWCGHVVVGNRAVSSSPEKGVHYLPTRLICEQNPGAVLLRVGA